MQRRTQIIVPTRALSFSLYALAVEERCNGAGV